MEEMDEAYLQTWIGRQEILIDTITATQADALAATIDKPDIHHGDGDALPIPWHWLYFLPKVKAADIALDGHAKKGGFLPPVALPRRMWAGSRMVFHSPLRVGDTVKRISTIKSVTLKQGKTGQLVFVTVVHEIFVINSNDNSDGRERLVLHEEQDIVYREASKASDQAPALQLAPAKEQWSKSITADPVLLFRFSALTFNAHRIHYDRHYAMEQEGYEGLVVHGPLTAILLLDFLNQQFPNVSLSDFRFRGLRSLTDNSKFSLQGRCDGDQVSLWVLDDKGAMTMKAEAKIKPSVNEY